MSVTDTPKNKKRSFAGHANKLFSLPCFSSLLFGGFYFVRSFLRVGAAIWYASRKGNVKIVESLIEAVTHDEYGGRKKLPTSNQHLTQAVVDCYDREGENFTEIVKMINSNY